jgi:cupin fold WbuC family metalloprotein
VVIIDSDLLDRVTLQAQASPRLRMNHNFHKRMNDPVQRMLNAIEPNSYIQPHKHEDPDKREAFFLLRGSLLVVEFEDNGSIFQYTLLNHKGGVLGCEIAERRFHTLISLQPGTIIYELKDGPYNPVDDKNFASWAPKEGDKGCAAYQKMILREWRIE